MVQTKADVIQLIRENEAQLRALGVKRLGLFGSFVRGEQKPESDVDFLVEFEPAKKTFDNFMDTAFLLEDTCERKIDFVTLESLSPYIGPYILKEVQYVPFTDELSSAHP